MKKSLFLLGFSIWMLDANLLYGQNDINVGSRIRFNVANADTPGNKAVFGLDAGAGKSFMFYNYFSGKKLVEINGQSGNLGIGVSSPTSKLSIYGTSEEGWDSGLELNRENGSQARMIVNSSAMVFRTFGGLGHFYFRNKNDNTIFALTNEGNAGIGIITPSAKLEVSAGGLAAGSPMVAINNTFVTENDNPEDNRPFVIRRYINDNESFSSFLTDTRLNLVYKNDEAYSTINFRMINTDTETGGGAQANDHIVMALRGGTDGGRVGIGTSNPAAGYRLSVNGQIRAKEIKVEADWADFVFEDNYNLRSLDEVEAYIKENKHLPEIPTAEEVKENGVSLGEVNTKLLQKIEELTLYMIEMKKENEQLKNRLNSVEETLKKQ